MNEIAATYASQGIGSIFLYTHEAHPGEHMPHLTSMAQKLAHGRALQEVYGVTRPILADALDGACHRAYGSNPNMTWIFTRLGTPLYKSDWTDANSVANTLDYLLNVAQRRGQGRRLSPFRVERLDYRDSDCEAFFAGLARNGPKAVREFEQAF